MSHASSQRQFRRRWGGLTLAALTVVAGLGDFGAKAHAESETGWAQDFRTAIDVFR